MKKELSELDKIDVSSIKKMFYNDINTIPVLSKEEEIKLIKESQEGNIDSTNKLITHNIKLVRDIARKYKKDGIEELDLVEEGILGLYVAIKNFNLEMGTKLSTYAKPNIESYIQKFAQKNSQIVYVPWDAGSLLYKYNSFVKGFLRDNGRYPTREEVSITFDIPEKKVKELENLAQNPISLDMYVDEDEEKTLKDNLYDINSVPEDIVINKMINEKIQGTKDIVFNISTLSKREKEVLLYKCGFITGHELTFEEIGNIYEVSRQRIKQIFNKAIKKILLSKEAKELAYLTRNPDEALKLIKETRKSR